MIHLEIAGPHTRLCSTLCAACPFASAGCCTSPPEHDWSDLGRVVAAGGRDWVLAQIAAKNLVPAARGLAVRRVRRRESLTAPREHKCVYHGARGCTIDPSLRPATCNYFLCDEAYVEGGERRGDPAAVAARAQHRALIDMYTAWDRDIEARVRERFPEGVPWDAAFLDWLGQEFERLSTSS
jgi:hypothetical protein